MSFGKINYPLNLEKEILLLESEVKELKALLEQERLIRKNKDEYDSIAAEILKYPSRPELFRYVYLDPP